MICDFINVVATQRYLPNMDIIKNGSGIFADLCEFYEGEMEKYINRNTLEGMIRVLNNSRENVELLDWVIRSVDKTFPSLVIN